MPTQLSPSQMSKPQTPKRHAQQIAKQVLQEPFEILKTAGSQVAGSEYYGGGNKGNMGGDDIKQKELEEKKKKETARVQSHTQAFQQELQEIKQIQKQRDYERQQLRLEEEQQKKQVLEQQKKSNPFVEIAGKVKRGVLGGVGKMMGVRKKQRSTELVKTPSN